MVLGEIGRFPNLAPQLYRTAVSAAEEQLAAYLEDRTAAGALSVADPERAATHLLDLTTGAARFRTLFGVLEPLAGPPDETSISPAVDRRAIRTAVRMFVDQYAR